MYTELKAYQIIIALLKKWGISHCVLSAGSRNVPFVHSIEKDPFFHCYSVVDERSAGYFALGLSQELNEPVVISCTSSTATANYWPPMAEAFYQGAPIIALTSDRDPAMLGQWEDQMIDQVGMFDRHVKKSVNLPIVNNKDDEIFCQRLVNEALLELDHNGTGPVHINVPMKSYNNSFNVKRLPDVTKIDRINIIGDKSLWDKKVKKLEQAKKILVVCGQNVHVSKKLEDNISNFFNIFNSAVTVEYTSNIQFGKAINSSVIMDSRYVTRKKVKELLPDIVISFGGNIMSGIKEQLQKFAGDFEHWSIQQDGRVVDVFKSITTIFECTPEYFFEYCNKTSASKKNDLSYYSLWSTYENNIVIPEFPYSHVYAIKNVVERIPSNSLLHLSINDSIRITNFFKLAPNIKIYANIGTHGIDGCLSSFLGQGIASPKKQNYLIIGDLSFFYGMNAMRLRNIGKNSHILLINNEGGSEFYFNKMWKDEASDLHTTARHHSTAEGWVKSNNFEYLCAHDKDSFDRGLTDFMSEDTSKPIFFEVFTEMKHDADVIYDFFDLSRPRDLKSESIRRSKKIIKSTIGEDRAKKLASKFKFKF
ncbi:2-succinyl-5-enolpyruvyl-6-hydroxy-3-cyclohexene-1-carboxylic-acid synthase [Companilactobacillus insicii]|uniref:2-succinyl-5-enolpyruvyl-6-hydroxy-3- cyclohexene-1-carboxylic-acid synthase n=1 Tax=Companilactobacillus insicii TaxID=1732567 RepID=UPI000F77CAF7|nr:2-succinyl-5-enolpyruvyl-6-hydroxy-3-cyclohexene-1-carboxylic-acid synthase [Companilactobacillus insicii]